MPRHIYLEPHLTNDDLEARCRSCYDSVKRSHWHFLWLLARGMTATAGESAQPSLAGRHDAPGTIVVVEQMALLHLRRGGLKVGEGIRDAKAARRRKWAQFIGRDDGRRQRYPVPLPIYIVQRLRLKVPNGRQAVGGEGPAFSRREHGDAHQSQITGFLVWGGWQLLLHPVASREVRDEWAVVAATGGVLIIVRPHHPCVVWST